MKLNKIEITAILLTLAVICFTGGFYAGRRKAVVITEYSQGTALSVSVADTKNNSQVNVRADTENKTRADGGQDAEKENAALEDEREKARQESVTNGQGDTETKTPQDTWEETGTENEPPPDGQDEKNNEPPPDAQEANLGKLNINTASHKQLTGLPGIGDVLADRIIEYRDTHGAFINIYDIMNVSGIGEKRFAAIKDLIFAG